MRVGWFLSAALLTQPIVARAQDDASVLQPSSPWNLRYDEDKCRMVRKFGEGEQSVTLLLDQTGIEPYYTLTLIGHPIDASYGKFMRVKFGNEQPSERSHIKGKLGDDTPLVAMHGVNLAPVPELGDSDIETAIEAIGPVREAAIDHISFSKGLDDPLTLATGSLGEPLAAMRKCANDLVQYLGVSDGPNPNLSKAAQPKGSPGTWVTDQDYPTAMINRDEEGVVQFRLTVDGRGKPTSCHIARSTRPQVFDDIVCLALLKRAEFTPALDLEGKPVASYYRSAVRFSIPD